jgi:hypothetical protein
VILPHAGSSLSDRGSVPVAVVEVGEVGVSVHDLRVVM